MSSCLAALLLGLWIGFPGEAPARDCMDPACHGEGLRRSFLHEPVAKGKCGSCHVPKPARPPSPGGCAVSTELARARGPALCGRCHQPPPPFHDSGTEAGLDPCLRCHDPHGGESPAELRGPEGDLCLACHAAELAPPRSRRIPPAPGGQEGGEAPPEPEVHRHGPVAERQCAPCHPAHGAGPPHLLKGRLPEALHAPYSRSAYSACYRSCHSPTLVEEARTTEATRFRNGDENLHTRHVVRETWGRSCRLCHAPHQATNPALIRASMPFGKEKLMLEFTATRAGGKCATSCHIPAGYDREEAVPSAMRVLATGTGPARGGLP